MRSHHILLALTLVAGAGCERSTAPAPAPVVAEAPTLTDSALYAQSVRAVRFWWYQGDSARRRSSAQSGHTPYQRVRYNLTAYRALTDGGRLPRGGSFPVGSLIVKELYADSATAGPPALYAVMKKEPTNINAAQGWLWGEYLPGLSADYIRLDGRGAACTGCHSAQGNRDYTRLFDVP